MKRCARIALCGILLSLMVSAITPASAAVRVEPHFTMSSDPAKIAAEVLSDGNAFVFAYGTSKADKNRILNDVQSYVDAVSVSSMTPKVKGSVVNSGKSNEQIKMVLVYGEDEFTERELRGLVSKAGRTAQSISAYLCGELSYDRAAANKKLSADSSQVTAKGSLSSGKAVCQGYANSFAILAERAGIRSVKVRGYNDGVFHVMNVVEGGFAVDVTYSDSFGENYIMVPFEKYCEQSGFEPVVDFELAFELKYGAPDEVLLDN